MGYIVSCRYRHPIIGPVNIKVHSASTHIRARWKGQELLVTLPQHCPEEIFNSFLRTHVNEILAARPATRYYNGLVIEAPDSDFTLSASANPRISILTNEAQALRGKAINYTIHYPATLEEDSANFDANINMALRKCARHATARFIIPHAQTLAAELRCPVTSWHVNETTTRLGSCRANGRITLSALLAFLPYDLRDYIIFHELAHLTHFNHTKAFHALCNSYCGGREKEFIAKLKAFHWPI